MYKRCRLFIAIKIVDPALAPNVIYSDLSFQTYYDRFIIIIIIFILKQLICNLGVCKFFLS